MSPCCYFSCPHIFLGLVLKHIYCSSFSLITIFPVHGQCFMEGGIGLVALPRDLRIRAKFDGSGLSSIVKRKVV